MIFGVPIIDIVIGILAAAGVSLLVYTLVKPSKKKNNCCGNCESCKMCRKGKPN